MPELEKLEELLEMCVTHGVTEFRYDKLSFSLLPSDSDAPEIPQGVQSHALLRMAERSAPQSGRL